MTLMFFFSSRRRHTRCSRDWSSDVCSSDLLYAMTHSEMFKAGISVAPVSDWHDYDSTYTERYLDRKSTRLNSSHGYISYAVFCLKKKKKTLMKINISLQASSSIISLRC